MSEQRKAFEKWYKERHPNPVHENSTWAHASEVDDWEVWQAALASQSPKEAMSEAARDVLAERRRQKISEGFSSARDDSYTNNELAHAAATYAYPALHSIKGLKVWPWGDMWFKVRDHRRNMIKAGALILAEIERLDRAALAAVGEGP